MTCQLHANPTPACRIFAHGTRLLPSTAPRRTLLSRYPEALVVPDLTQDVRFKDSPIVTEWPRARFYAACPLVAHTGSRLGTL